mmetsp:Transcript_11368/g.19747  ORF Transcript_11368/g.19747 Transcript_11368/m.19747 type:complete len:92 (-) Transcript_11368:1136-1411(-)
MIPNGMAMYNWDTTINIDTRAAPHLVLGVTSPYPTVDIVDMTSHALSERVVILSRGSTRKIADEKMQPITAKVYNKTGRASKQSWKAVMRI